MIDSQDICDSIVSRLLTNITDINSDRISKGISNWIYSDSDRMDVSGYPRVRVISPASNSSPHSLSSNSQRVISKIEIQIRVKKENKFTINAVSYDAVHAIGYLSAKITDYLRQVTTRNELLAEDGSYYFDLESENTIFGEIIVRQLIYKTIFVR
jgi:hypothetical protein